MDPVNLYQSFCKTEIRYLQMKQWKQKLPEYINDYTLVILSEAAALRFGLSELLKKKRKETSFEWISHVSSNPTYHDIYECVNEIGNKRIHRIIAIGGGSAIDLAKGIAAFYNKGLKSAEDVLFIIKEKSISLSTEIEIVAVPTTAGTGSEVTQWATVWDNEKGKKYSIDHYSLVPRMAYMVPELTYSMDKTLTISTGLDALAHAVEAYWSRWTTPIAQAMAIQSIDMILNELPKLVNKLNDSKGREKMQTASLLAGLAFSKTRTTVCHAISYPMTARYNIPHGFAAALTLDAVLRRNEGYYPDSDRLNQLLKEHNGILKWMEGVVDHTLLFQLTNIHDEDVYIIADEAMQNGRICNNPVELSVQDIRQIITESIQYYQK